MLAEWGAQPGLVHICAAMESCAAFTPWHEKVSGKMMLRYMNGECLHYYFYVKEKMMGPEFQGIGLDRGNDPGDNEDRSEKRAISRAGVIKTSVALGGAVLGTDLLRPTRAGAVSIASQPKPILQGGIPGAPAFRVHLFGPGKEPSTITDFNGYVGVTDVQGMATNAATGERFLVDTDMRFMDGVYVGVDGRVHRGTFGFV